MRSMQQSAALAGLAALLVLACDPVLESEAIPEGVRFSYSGAASGTFASAGTVAAPGGGLPDLETFAMAQRDSIGGLLLGSFRKTGEGRGDLFILQIRGSEPTTYSCGASATATNCYGHLYIGVEVEGGTASADAIYGISSGEVVVEAVGSSRIEGRFDLTLRDLEDQAATIAIENGSIDVPLVEGVFNSTFVCLAVRLQEGPEAPCD